MPVSTLGTQIRKFLAAFAYRLDLNAMAGRQL